MSWQPPFLETERLTLRPITLNDADSVFNYSKKFQVTKYLSWNPHQSIEDTQTFINDIVLSNYQKKIHDAWGICLKNDPIQVIGTFSCRPYLKLVNAMEIGYALDDIHWGHGLIVEAGRAVIKYMSETYGIQQFVGIYIENNLQSKRVFEKLGFESYSELDHLKRIKNSDKFNHGMWLNLNK